jgi:hypothetical protein
VDVAHPQRSPGPLENGCHCVEQRAGTASAWVCLGVAGRGVPCRTRARRPAQRHAHACAGFASYRHSPAESWYGGIIPRQPDRTRPAPAGLCSRVGGARRQGQTAVAAQTLSARWRWHSAGRRWHSAGQGPDTRQRALPVPSAAMFHFLASALGSRPLDRLAGWRHFRRRVRRHGDDFQVRESVVSVSQSSLVCSARSTRANSNSRSNGGSQGRVGTRGDLW